MAWYYCFATVRCFLFPSSRQVERVCVELYEAMEQHDRQLTERLLPVVKQRHDAVTQALSDCLAVKDVARHWYFSHPY